MFERSSVFRFHRDLAHDIYLAAIFSSGMIFTMIFIPIGMAGYIILIVSRNYALSYFAIYLAAAGRLSSKKNSPLIPKKLTVRRFVRNLPPHSQHYRHSF